MLIKSSRRPVKSGYSNVEKALNELEDYFNRSADGDTIYTRISHDDENHIAKVCEEHNVDFSVSSYHVTLYPIESSRRLVKSGLDKETLIEKINEVEPDDYSDWSVEELQELAINLGISIESSRKISSSVHVSDLTEQEKDDLYEIEKKEAEEHYNSLDDSDKQMLRLRYGIKNAKDYVKFFIVHPNKLRDDYKFIIDPRPKLNSRKSVKSSFVVGKTMDDGSKLYYCEDNCFYNENDYSRPSIKIFDNKREADKIAKRSKSGFVIPF